VQIQSLTQSLEPRSSPVSGQGTPSGRSTRTVKGTRSSRLAEVSVPGGGQRGKASLDPGTEDEGDDDAMEIDEEDSKVAAPKDKSKPSKGTATKTSTRRSGRKK